MLASWVWKGFVSFEAGLLKKSGGVGGGGGGGGGGAAPPICKPNAGMIGLDRIHMLRSELARFQRGGGGSGGVQPSLHRLQTQFNARMMALGRIQCFENACTV